MNVEDIASQSTVVFQTPADSITEKTISGVYVFPRSEETLVREVGSVR